LQFLYKQEKMPAASAEKPYGQTIRQEIDTS
jgi:hypothetical protein